MKNLLLQYVNYNHWANCRLAEVLKGIDVSVLDSEVKSSFPSLRKTCNHILDAEVIWLERLKKNDVVWPPSEHMFKDCKISQFADFSDEFIRFVEMQEESWFELSLSYKNSKGESFVTSHHGVIMHCMNHSTFHRGQLVTIMRELGVTKIPSTDLINYLRLK